MTAEQIVRALAAADPYGMEGYGDDVAVCPMCRVDDSLLPRELQASDHEPDCPWRLAVEFVAAQDEGRAALDVDTLVGAIRDLSRPGYPPENAAEIVAEIHALASAEVEARREIDMTAAHQIHDDALRHLAGGDCRGPVDITLIGGEPEYACTRYGERRCVECPGEAAANLKHGTGGEER